MNMDLDSRIGTKRGGKHGERNRDSTKKSYLSEKKKKKFFRRKERDRNTSSDGWELVYKEASEE